MPDKVITYNSLKRQGYTGKIFIVCSKDDKALPEYKTQFGDEVLVFDKNDYKNEQGYDIFDNNPNEKAVVYARNACFDLAKQHGIDYFLMLDDDYTDFRYKFNSDLKYSDYTKVKRLDNIFNIFLNFYKSINCLTMSFSQGGDFIGGKNGSGAEKIKIKRKAMNTFFCSIHRPFKFTGRINEDVNMYVSYGIRGHLVFQTNQFAINQITTQSNSGGLTDIYLDLGTYVKSFYTVLCAPSCTKIIMVGTEHRRLHHRISWDNCAVKIISQDYKKTSNGN